MTILTAAPEHTDIVSGQVTTPVFLMRTLPDRVPHASFGLEAPDHRRYAIHITGSLAEKVRADVHRGAAVTITDGIEHQRPDARVIDVDVTALVIH